MIELTHEFGNKVWVNPDHITHMISDFSDDDQLITNLHLSTNMVITVLENPQDIRAHIRLWSKS